MSMATKPNPSVGFRTAYCVPDFRSDSLFIRSRILMPLQSQILIAVPTQVNYPLRFRCDWDPVPNRLQLRSAHCKACCPGVHPNLTGGVECATDRALKQYQPSPTIRINAQPQVVHTCSNQRSFEPYLLNLRDTPLSAVPLHNSHQSIVNADFSVCNNAQVLCGWLTAPEQCSQHLSNFRLRSGGGDCKLHKSE